MSEEQKAQQVEDLDVTADEAQDVKGGGGKKKPPTTSSGNQQQYLEVTLENVLISS